ncbi:hypothetical protein [uncultured Friedmanniella sp.]|uniref:hypothetical protein n=1 Tax=uncultured Friedmanniella sp. TaxID=335381 RepID=UPI0035CBFFCF
MAPAPPEPVEVRGLSDGAGPPTQILWRNELWLVREARPDRWAPGAASWRVLAGQGPDRPQQTFGLACDEGGRWWLQPAST